MTCEHKLALVCAFIIIVPRKQINEITVCLLLEHLHFSRYSGKGSLLMKTILLVFCMQTQHSTQMDHAVHNIIASNILRRKTDMSGTLFLMRPIGPGKWQIQVLEACSGQGNCSILVKDTAFQIHSLELPLTWKSQFFPSQFTTFKFYELVG